MVTLGVFLFVGSLLPFHEAGAYHIEISPLICIVNQRTGFYMMGTSVMKELRIIHLVPTQNYPKI